jgi:phage terminase small subunit
MTHLTIKQERFAQKYVELGNANEAYRQTYDAENMVPESVHNEAHLLLKHPEVSIRVARLEELQRKRHEVTVDRIVSEYSKLAFLDIRKAFDDEGNLLTITTLDDDTAAAIAGIEFEEVFEQDGRKRTHVGRIHKIKLSDKKGALDSLAKFLGMFTDKVELTGKDGKPIEISDAKAALLRGLVPNAAGGGADQANS